jgi:hypothetical protein
MSMMIQTKRLILREWFEVNVILGNYGIYFRD